MGAGSMIGSLSLAFAVRRPMLGLMLGGGAAFVAFQLLLGLTREPNLAFPLILLVGLSSMVMVNTINVMVQNSVSHELRGRVMSLYVTVFAGSAPIGGFFAGAVAELWQAPAGFVLGSLLSVLAIGLVAWQLLPRDQPWTDASAATSPVASDEDTRRVASR
jgi:predicted MFS family arabinose efflux permease